MQHRVFQSSPERAFVFQCSDEAKEFLLSQGIDAKYGARHVKRAIERSLVQPLSNLIATDQIRLGDSIRIGFDAELSQLTFLREAEGMSPVTMAQISDLTFSQQLAAAHSAVDVETGRTASARFTRR